MLVIPMETTISEITDTLRLQKLIADKLKLTVTPTCISKQPLKGRIIGAIEHVGCGRTYIKN
jgi:hypothetical protein